ncbi:MAG TPA: CRTAC1 family protein, partial [Pirellulaceae bacterium]|nr:CRTAC1 family protein [Pirellulaceae bacterium]
LWRALPDGSFQDITDAAGVRDLYYSQGVTIGDFDDDGFDDIYVLNYGRNTLLKNLGDGTFHDVTEAAGVGDELWSSSGAWGDLDGDGDLDLYVCNYCNYDTRNPPDCSKDGKPHICHPREVPPVPDECYINQGDGTFTAEAKRRGLFGDGNRGLGVVVFDFDQDGDADVYVANDMTPNFLFVNDGTGMFKESAMQLGCAVDRNGSPQASMGLACGDYDGDGWLDLYSTHFQFDSNTLYRNLGAGPAGFQDVTGLVGLHSPTLPYLAFGTVMVDFNRDTRQELFVANGHLEPVLVEGKTVFEMNAQLFAFDGRRFQECTKSAGDYFAKKWIARGVAVCDINDDGAADLCVVHQDAPTALLENTSQFGHGLTLRFRGLAANRRGVGVQVRVTAGGKTYFQELCGGTSYASSHQPALFFGLGEFSGECDVEVRWPTGETQKLNGVSVNQSLVIEQSRGR